MRNKILFAAFIALLFSFSANAQLFWKVSGNGLAKPSYLFGTHHLIEKEKIANFDKVLAYVPQVDVIVGEMDMSNMLDMQIKMIKECIMKDTTMHQLLTTEEYALVDSGLKEVVGKGLKSLGKIKPVMLSTMYELMFYMKQNKLKKEPESVDMVFQKEGKKAKKKIIGFETIEQQMDILFNSKSLKLQALDLVEAVKNKDKSSETLIKLNEAYLKGDLTTMSKLSDDQQMSDNDKKILITNRNKNWMEQLKKLMPDKSCFVCVGCLHLADEEGLIQLLKNAGYSVDPVLL